MVPESSNGFWQRSRCTRDLFLIVRFISKVRVLHSLGRADSRDVEALRRPAANIRRFLEPYEGTPLLVDIRPVYHRLENRIRSDVLLCWLVLLLIRVVENGTGKTWRQVRAHARQA